MRSNPNFSSLFVGFAVVVLIFLVGKLVLDSVPISSGLKTRFETPSKLEMLPANTAQSLPLTIGNDSNSVVRVVGCRAC